MGNCLALRSSSSSIAPMLSTLAGGLSAERLHRVGDDARWTVSVVWALQLPTSSTSRRDGYSCGFDLCLSSKGHSKWMASKRLSAEGHLLQGSWQGVDPTWKDVGNCKRLGGTLPAS